MFSSQLLKGSWYYSAFVFTLWTLSSLELTLHQTFGSRVALDDRKPLLKCLPLGGCLFSELPVRTFNAFLFSCAGPFFREDRLERGTKTKNDNLLQRSQDNFQPGTLSCAKWALWEKCLFCPELGLPGTILPGCMLLLTGVWAFICC